ncbi:MAG: glycosyltransferase family 1 protein [Patescibacteria group bacterium]
MKIGVDISPIVYGSGVSVYLDNLFDQVLKVDTKNQYQFFFSSLRRSQGKFPAKSFKIPPRILDWIWNRFHVLPIESLIGPVDVFHASDWTQPPAKKAKLVTTIHDLSFLRWPETVHPRVLAAQKKRLEWVEKEADAVIAVSQATKDEILSLLKIPEKKIFVVHEALPQDVVKPEKKGDLSQYGIRGNYLFAYGSQAPRKNIGQLLKAFGKVRKNIDCQLVISGGYQGPDLPGVIYAGFVSRPLVLTFLSQASAFIYPSLYEGFGLPILEAFYLETPVVTSNCSSMKEVAGQAAVLVDPLSVDSIARGIKQALGNREKLLLAGKKRLKNFSWQTAAEKTVKIYQNLHGN